MHDLIIENIDNKYTFPEIRFLANEGKCIIEGISFVEYVFEFYEPLIEWIKNYFNEHHKKNLKFILKLKYYNISSLKILAEILNMLNDYKNNGHNITIEWHYNSYNLDLIENIKDLIDLK